MSGSTGKREGEEAVGAAGARHLRLHVRYDEGTGPLLVLLHGLNADAREWRPVINAIGPEYRCLACDLLGYGDSPRPPDLEYTADQHAAALEETLRHLGITESFVLVGYSLGGDIAVRYAATWPQRLRRLVLVAAPFYLPPERYQAWGFSSRVIQAWLARWTWAFVARGRRDSTRLYEIASGRFHDLTRQLLQTEDIGGGWDIMSKNLLNCVSRATFVDELPRLSMPTVFVVGIRDPVVRPDQALALRRMMPELGIRRIVDRAADHMLLHALPERVAREIVRDEIGRLHVAWRGGRGEPLALLAGPEGAAAWRPVAGSLARRFDVAIVEMLGFGGSPAPLTIAYDLGDHVAALRATARALWPGDTPVHIVGQALGGTVALGHAACSSERVAAVTAFSPACVPPGRTAEQAVRSPEAAGALAAWEQVAAHARDERARGLVGDALERRMVPLFRSLRSIALGTDPAPLVAATRAPVRLVLPAGDLDAPRDWARSLAAAGRIALSEPAGGRGVVFDRPALAVAEIAPDLAAETAPRAPARRRRGESPYDVLRSADRSFILRGAGSIGLGALLLSPLPIAAVWVARGFAAWVAWSAVLTLLGARGVRRDGNATWIVWGLNGILGLSLAILLSLDQRHAVSLFGFFVLVWLLWHAFADLFVAWRVPATPTPRWTLWLQGLLALGAAAVGVIFPRAGGTLLRLILGAYFVGSGLMLAGYGGQSLLRASRRVRELLAASRRWTAPPCTSRAPSRNPLDPAGAGP